MLERIIAYITSNIGTTFSSTAISKYLKSEGRSVSPETVLNYIKACTDAFLFYQVKRQDLQGKKILTVNEKYYVADHGVREAVYGGNMKDINLVLENVVYMELLRRGYSVTVGKVSDKEITSYVKIMGKSCMFRFPIYLPRRKPSSVSLGRLPVFVTISRNTL